MKKILLIILLAINNSAFGQEQEKTKGEKHHDCFSLYFKDLLKVKDSSIGQRFAYLQCMNRLQRKAAQEDSKRFLEIMYESDKEKLNRKPCKLFNPIPDRIGTSKIPGIILRRNRGATEELSNQFIDKNEDSYYLILRKNIGDGRWYKCQNYKVGPELKTCHIVTPGLQFPGGGIPPDYTYEEEEISSDHFENMEKLYEIQNGQEKLESDSTKTE